MKKKLFPVLVSIMVMGTSCTQSESKTMFQDTSEASNAKGLVVTLDAKFTANDRFELFYSDDNSFEGKKVIRKTVYGEPTFQKIEFVLPEGEKPQYLRLDLGNNANQTDITIKDISLNYKGFIIEGEDEKYLNYFPSNSTVSYNPNELNFKLLKTNEGVFDPILFSNDDLKKELNKIYNSFEK